jgi:tetratricopeptide (TPR) repeat protein
MPKKFVPRSKLTPKQKRNLDIEIKFLEGIVKRDPLYIDALKALAEDYTKIGRFEDGLKIDKQLASLLPYDPTVIYNLACSYSLTGQFDNAINEIKKAVELGFSDLEWILLDPDLIELRKQKAFKEILPYLKKAKRISRKIIKS